MKKFILPIIIVVAIAAGTGFYFWHQSGAPIVQRQHLAAQIYQSRNAPFTIQPPKDWVIDDTGANGTIVIFVDPALDSEDDVTLPASINVLSEPLQGLSREEYIRVSKENLRQYSPAYAITVDSPAKVQNYDAHIFEGHFSSQGRQIRNRQLFVFFGDTVYIITGTSLASAWDQHRQIINDSLGTFAIVAK